MSLLYLGIGRSVAIAPQLNHSLRRHSALEILLSLEHPFLFRTGSSEWVRTNAVAVDPGVPHQAKELRGMFASILLLAERRFTRGRRGGALRDGPIHFLSESERGREVSFFRGVLDRETGCSKVFQEVERLVGALADAPGTGGELDGRLLNVLEWIQRSLAGRIRSKDLAYVACLSEDRFLHLFKEELGITVRRYVGLQRIMRATTEILGGKTLTRAALDAGFSDSSHFTRRFLEFNGFLPSRLKQYRGTATVRTCYSARCVRPSSPTPRSDVCAECQLYAGRILSAPRV